MNDFVEPPAITCPCANQVFDFQRSKRDRLQIDDDVRCCDPIVVTICGFSGRHRYDLTTVEQVTEVIDQARLRLCQRLSPWRQRDREGVTPFLHDLLHRIILAKG